MKNKGFLQQKDGYYHSKLAGRANKDRVYGREIYLSITVFFY